MRAAGELSQIAGPGGVRVLVLPRMQAIPDSKCLSSALEADACPEEDRQDPESHVNLTVVGWAADSLHGLYIA